MRVGLIWIYRRLLLILLTPLLLLPVPLVLKTKTYQTDTTPKIGDFPILFILQAAECAYTLLLMGTFWLSEALPIAITALIPAILFPLFGIMTSSQVAAVFFKDFHLLFTGVMCLAAAIEKWGLHRRIALGLINMVGVNPGRLMLGSMFGCAFLSMWLSNTSTVAMVMPIVEAVLKQMITAEGEAREQRKRTLTGTLNLGLQHDEVDRPDEDAKEKTSVDPAEMETEDSTIEKSPPECEGESCVSEAEGTSSQKYYRTRQDHLLCKGISLGIAYSATIGGLTTLPGTTPNLILAEYVRRFYPDCRLISFGNWFICCLPITIISLLLSWIWLHWLYLGSDFLSVVRCSKAGHTERGAAVAKVLHEDYKALGPISRQEIISLVVFLLMVLLWFTREPGFMPGWTSLLPETGYASDATVALLLGLLLFIIPAQLSHKYESLISWKDFQSTMPWEICLLVGGGFALAEGTQASGLSQWVANLLLPLGELPQIATVIIVCIIVTSITEVASNSATTTIFLPILGPLAENIGVNPLFMIIPATLSACCSFLLPSSNPPNAIVFSYGHVSIWDMVKAGLGVNIITVLALLLAVTTWGMSLFSLDVYPEWAPNPSNSTGIPN